MIFLTGNTFDVLITKLLLVLKYEGTFLSLAAELILYAADPVSTSTQRTYCTIRHLKSLY